MGGEVFLQWHFLNQLCLPGFPSRTEAGQAEVSKVLLPQLVVLLSPELPTGCTQQQSPRRLTLPTWQGRANRLPGSGQ